MSGAEGPKWKPIVDVEKQSGKELERMKRILQNLESEQTANRKKLQTHRGSRIQNKEEMLKLQTFIGTLQEEMGAKKKEIRAWKKARGIK